VGLSQVKLTQLVRNAGCASKISPADLDAVLARLPVVEDPAVISGLAAADDAAIYRLADNQCLVQTVDVFTPCVDDPHLFGRICAANCLSDIYAMGGEPRTALSILAFPAEALPGEIMYQMLVGAMAVFSEAGVALVGGHSLKDEEIKLGFAITGLIDPAIARALEQPQPGDVLVLTKPLGTGVLAFSHQIGRGHAEGLAAAQTTMATLNRGAAEAMRVAGASACTDVTGFGLFAHLMRMLRASGWAAQVFAESLPAFPGALEALGQGVIPGAIERNREYVGDLIRVAPGVEEARVNLGFDAQTSGGLLIAVPPARLGELHRQLAQRGVAGAVVGRIVPRTDVLIEVVATDAAAGSTPDTAKAMNPPATPETHSPDCCADVFGSSSSTGTAAESQRAFGALMRSVQAPGALNAKVKELILFSQVLQSRCAPCFDAHYRQAREMGLTQAELDEAAWCAIAMGGAPVKMFYQESLERVKG
jgi:selenide,water dikinase